MDQNFLLVFFHNTSPTTISCCPQDLAELRAQITKAGVHVDVDARKGQDLARVMEEMREKYEKIALKNQAELKAWHESQVIHKLIVTVVSLIFKIVNMFSLASDYRGAGSSYREHNSTERSYISAI